MRRRRASSGVRIRDVVEPVAAADGARGGWRDGGVQYSDGALAKAKHWRRCKGRRKRQHRHGVGVDGGVVGGERGGSAIGAGLVSLRAELTTLLLRLAEAAETQLVVRYKLLASPLEGEAHAEALFDAEGLVAGRYGGGRVGGLVAEASTLVCEALQSLDAQVVGSTQGVADGDGLLPERIGTSTALLRHEAVVRHLFRQYAWGDGVAGNVLSSRHHLGFDEWRVLLSDLGLVDHVSFGERQATAAFVASFTG